jgi:S-DNA-T family DNA segregation ATPase FtsK/SpoIIIE
MTVIDRTKYKEAVKIVLETRQASVSLIQRKMRLGYTESARLIDQMETDGIISPYQGSTPRKVLAKTVTWKDEQ